MPHDPILCHRCGLRIPDEGECIPSGDSGDPVQSDAGKGDVNFDFDCRVPQVRFGNLGLGVILSPRVADPALSLRN